MPNKSPYPNLDDAPATEIPHSSLKLSHSLIFAQNPTLIASLNRKYVCLPEYECICGPKGKAVSESTKLNHRRAANKRRSLTRMQLLSRGPFYSQALDILRHYDVLSASLEREECLQGDNGEGGQWTPYPEDREGGSYCDEPAAFVNENENVCSFLHDGTHLNNKSGH